MRLYQIYFLDESKWTQLLKAGKLSRSSLLRIQKYKGSPDKYYVKQLLKSGQIKKAEEYLAKKGIVKSARQWLDGVERGSNNIIRKLGIKTVRGTDLDSEFAYSKGNKIYLTKTLSKKYHPDNVISKRHETDEIRTGLKDLKKLKNAEDVTTAKLIRQKKLKRTSNGKFDIGNHQSPEVLRREKELTNTSKSLYGKKGNPANLNKYRKNSKEYEGVGSKKEIRKFDKKVVKQLNNKTLIDLKRKFKELDKEYNSNNQELFNLRQEEHKLRTKQIELKVVDKKWNDLSNEIDIIAHKIIKLKKVQFSLMNDKIAVQSKIFNRTKLILKK